MKILYLNSYDIQGGAARAAYRLKNGLKGVGTTPRMLVQFNITKDPDIVGPTTFIRKTISDLRLHLDSFPVRFFPNCPLGKFSPAVLPDNLLPKVQTLDPDIIHLHWIAAGFIRIETLKKINRPMIWTLHDCWAFTGGCHYPDECIRYTESCGRCPVLGSTKELDFSYKNWWRKNRTFNEMEITIVAPSRWLGQCAGNSSLFKATRIEVIPNGLDLEIYKPSDRKKERDRFGLPQEKKLVLFGVMDAKSINRKGFHLLKAAFKQLKDTGYGKKLELVVFGSSEPSKEPQLGLKTNYVGYVKDENQLASLYAASDVIAVPSIQENLSNVVMESLACGLPVVAFDIGGMPDMIEHKKNGYLAQPFDVKDLAHGIEWVLEDEKRWDALSRRARQKAEQEFDILVVARKYLDLYNEILANK
jgi:glycosyltransferase involved in cell wall biosynthesis